MKQVINLNSTQNRSQTEAVIEFLSLETDGVSTHELWKCLTAADAPGWCGGLTYFRQILLDMVAAGMVCRVEGLFYLAPDLQRRSLP